MFVAPSCLVMREAVDASTVPGAPAPAQGSEVSPVAFVALGDATARILASLRPVVGKSQSA